MSASGRPSRRPGRSIDRAVRKAGSRARPGGKPRSPASGAATGASGGRPRRRPHLTSRSAILAIVVCAIVLSLAYPVREYIAQRREIAALRLEAQHTRAEIAALQHRKQQLSDPEYIKRQARSRLHYCMPGETCYVVADPGRQGDRDGLRGRPALPRPWYVTLWRSVETADQRSVER